MSLNLEKINSNIFDNFCHICRWQIFSFGKSLRIHSATHSRNETSIFTSLFQYAQLNGRNNCVRNDRSVCYPTSNEGLRPSVLLQRCYTIQLTKACDNNCKISPTRRSGTNQRCNCVKLNCKTRCVWKRVEFCISAINSKIALL